MRPPSWLKLSKPRREGDHAVVDVEVRERVFILAASRDQAEFFQRRWQAEKPNSRRLQDAIYLHGNALEGRMILPADRIVGVEGYWLHPKAVQIQRWLYRTCAKTNRPLVIAPERYRTPRGIPPLRPRPVG